jgi:hypothetical protein
MSHQCSSCGKPKHQYGPRFIQLWMDQERERLLSDAAHPVLSLPKIRVCIDCMIHAAVCVECKEYETRWATIGLRKRCRYIRARAAWLQSNEPIEHLDLSDPKVQKRIRKGQRAAKKYERLLDKQRQKFMRVKSRRFWRKMKRTIFREIRDREDAMKDVWERFVDGEE